jgi:hypothetical protein
MALCRGLPRTADLDSAMRLIEAARQALLGDGLLTVNHVQAPAVESPTNNIELQRIWSSRPDDYPVAGRKTKTLTDWTRQLLLRSEVFVGEGAGALAEAFDDHQRILSMGLRAVVNVPLVHQDGRCFATFNVLGRRERWQPDEPVKIEMLAAFARPCVALHEDRLQAEFARRGADALSA